MADPDRFFTKPLSEATKPKEFGFGLMKSYVKISKSRSGTPYYNIVVLAEDVGIIDVDSLTDAALKAAQKIESVLGKK